MSPDSPKETMEIRHDPVPGYRPVFYGLLAVAVLFLGFLFFNYLSLPV
jgi:hypothetical protein